MTKRGQTLVKLYCVSGWFELGLSVVDMVRGPSHFPILHLPCTSSFSVAAAGAATD